MILLTETTQTLKANTAIVPTTQLPIVIQYNNIAQDLANVDVGPKTVQSGVDNIETIFVPAPDENQKRRIVYVSVFNPNTETHTIRFRLINSVGPVNSNVHRVTLRQNWRAEYNVDNGWTVYNESGNIVSTNVIEAPVIAQSNPGALLTDLFTATTTTIINKMIVANRAAVAKTFRLSIAPLGAADAASQYLFYDVSIAKNETKEINGPFNLAATDKIRVYGQDNNVSFTINGIAQT